MSQLFKEDEIGKKLLSKSPIRKIEENVLNVQKIMKNWKENKKGENQSRQFFKQQQQQSISSNGTHILGFHLVSPDQSRIELSQSQTPYQKYIQQKQNKIKTQRYRENQQNVDKSFLFPPLTQRGIVTDNQIKQIKNLKFEQNLVDMKLIQKKKTLKTFSDLFEVESQQNLETDNSKKNFNQLDKILKAKEMYQFNQNYEEKYLNSKISYGLIGFNNSKLQQSSENTINQNLQQSTNTHSIHRNSINFYLNNKNSIVNQQQQKQLQIQQEFDLLQVNSPVNQFYQFSQIFKKLPKKYKSQRQKSHQVYLKEPINGLNYNTNNHNIDLNEQLIANVVQADLDFQEKKRKIKVKSQNVSLGLQNNQIQQKSKDSENITSNRNLINLEPEIQNLQPSLEIQNRKIQLRKKDRNQFFEHFSNEIIQNKVIKSNNNLNQKKQKDFSKINYQTPENDDFKPWEDDDQGNNFNIIEHLLQKYTKEDFMKKQEQNMQ